MCIDVRYLVIIFLQLVAFGAASCTISFVCADIHDPVIEYLSAHLTNEMNADFGVSSAAHCSLENVLHRLGKLPLFWSNVWEKIPFKLSLSPLVESTLSTYSFRQQLEMFSKHNLSMANTMVLDANIAAGGVESFQLDNDFIEQYVRSNRVFNNTMAALEQVADTGTLVVNNAHSVDPWVAQASEFFSSNFHVPFISVNSYTTRAGQTIAAPLHTDKMDSFVVQTQGSKRWSIYDVETGPRSTLDPWKHPLDDLGGKDRGKMGHVLAQADVGPLWMDVELERGQVIYIPRGIPHSTGTGTGTVDGAASTTSSNSIDPSYGHQTAEDVLDTASLSLTISLLAGSVGLTYDKLLRCAVPQLLCMEPTPPDLGQNTEPYCPALRAAEAWVVADADQRQSFFAMGDLADGQTSFVADLAAMCTKDSNSQVSRRRWTCGQFGPLARRLATVLIAAYPDPDNIALIQLTDRLRQRHWQHREDALDLAAIQCTINYTNSDPAALQWPVMVRDALRLIAVDVYGLLYAVAGKICEGREIQSFVAELGKMDTDPAYIRDPVGKRAEVCPLCGGLQRSDMFKAGDVSTLTLYRHRCYENCLCQPPNGSGAERGRKFHPIPINHRQAITKGLHGDHFFMPDYCPRPASLV